MAKVNQGQGWKTATTHTGTEVYYDPDEGRWEFARGVPIGRAARDHIMGQQQPAPTPVVDPSPVVKPPVVEEAPPPPPPPVVKPPSGPRGAPTTGVSGGGSSVGDRTTYDTAVNTGGSGGSTGSTGGTTSTVNTGSAPVTQQEQDYWKAAVTKDGRKATTEDPRQDPRVVAGTHYVGWGDAILPYSRNYHSADKGGIVTGNEEYDALTPKQKYDMARRYRELGGIGTINREGLSDLSKAASRQIEQAQARQEYDKLMEGNWSPERQAEVDRLYNDRMLTYDEYMEGAHSQRPDGQGGYEKIPGTTTVGYRPDGTYGWMDMRDYPGWTREMGQEMFSPSRADLNAVAAMGYDVTHMGKEDVARVLGGQGGAPQQAARQTGYTAPQTGGFTPAPYGNPQTGGNSHGQQDWRSFYDLAMGGNSMQAPAVGGGATGATGDWRAFYNQSMQATPSVAPQSDWDWRAYYDQAMRGGT